MGDFFGGEMKQRLRIGCLTVCWWVIFLGGGDETKASDWLSGAFATVKEIVFYCFF